MNDQGIVGTASIKRLDKANDKASDCDRLGMKSTIDVGGVSFCFYWIPQGCFWMGSPDDEEGRWSNEGPRHKVTLTKGFWLSETPCTQAFWKAVMGENPSHFKSPNHPVERVSWTDCQNFIKKLNSYLPGLEARLPTEAEWEYSCRAGTETSIYASNIDRIAWHRGNSGSGTHPVAQKDPNAWGLYDMLGNIEEWCSDYWQSPYGVGPMEDPHGPLEGLLRVARGSSWKNMRAAYRLRYFPDYRLNILGLRLARG